MSSQEFYSLFLQFIFPFLGVNFFIFGLFYLVLKRVLPNGVMDPLFIIFVIGFSTKYTIMCFLYWLGYIKEYYFYLFMLYLISVLSAYHVLRLSSFDIPNWYYRSYVNRRVALRDFEYLALLVVYFFVSIIILKSIGLGVFADTNRFENSRGMGVFVRLIDGLTYFLIAYTALRFFLGRGARKLVSFLMLAFLVVFSALLNGAKISFLFNVLAITFVYRIHFKRNLFSLKGVLITVLFGLIFIFFALQENLKRNGIDPLSNSENIDGVPLVVDKFVHRMVSNGNTVYMLLPNGNIDNIDTDSFLIRIITPMIGITQMSKLIGYNAGDYSVGRQALLTFNPDAEIAGGPTSHFDYFSYVYLGPILGFVFILIIGGALGILSRQILNYQRKSEKSLFLSSLLTAIWFRFCVVMVEPPIGIAYLMDLFLIFGGLFAFRLVALARRSGSVGI